MPKNNSISQRTNYFYISKYLRQQQARCFAEISEEIKKSVDHIVNLRQDEKEQNQSSTIIKLDETGFGFKSFANNLKELIQHDIFSCISECADELNLETYVIGGYVRDMLLQRKVPKDIDIVCVGSGIKLAKHVAKKLLGKPKVQVFKNFGTAMVQDTNFELEFVGARKESYQRNSRKPIVENGSLEDDQNRRDFSINTLAICLNKSRFGEFIDPFNGMDDLTNGIIKTPLNPDITYSDDPLRMMRAIRFASQLNFKIEQESLIAITRNADRLNIISQERITEELNKIILSKSPSKGFKLLFETNLLQQFFPEFVALYGVDVINGKKHKDNFYHTLEVLENLLQKIKRLVASMGCLAPRYCKTTNKTF